MTTIKEIARQAADEAVKGYNYGCDASIVADAVAVAVLRHVLASTTQQTDPEDYRRIHGMLAECAPAHIQVVGDVHTFGGNVNTSLAPAEQCSICKGKGWITPSIKMYPGDRMQCSCQKLPTPPTTAVVEECRRDALARMVCPERRLGAASRKADEQTIDALIAAVQKQEQERHDETVIAFEGHGIAPDSVPDGFSFAADVVRQKLAAVRQESAAEIERLKERMRLSGIREAEWNQRYHDQKDRAEQAEAALAAPRKKVCNSRQTSIVSPCKGYGNDR